MQNRLQALFRDRSKNRLSLYFTAGFPGREDTTLILESLQEAGADFVEIGFPFSDPLADGPVIQQSSRAALQNGMSLKLLFEQLRNIRQTVKIPLILMGYFNPVFRFGVPRFLEQCRACGIDGVILPDLPVDLYTEQYKAMFEEHNIAFIPLITPATGDERIRYLDEQVNGFIYMVSTHTTTGGKVDVEAQEDYFRRVRSLNLDNPLVLGFGVQTKEDIAFAGTYCDGVIVGSAFVRHLQAGADRSKICSFVRALRGSRQPENNI